MSAARGLLAERGYTATSIPEVVKRAGVAQGTFYRYFDGKAELLDALSTQLQQEIQDGLNATIVRCGPDEPVATLISELIKAALDVIQRYDDIYRFLNTEELLFGSSPNAARQRAGYIAVVAKLLIRDQAAGLTPADLDPQLTATLIGAILDQTARTTVNAQADPTKRNRTIDNAVTFITRALRTS